MSKGFVPILVLVGILIVTALAGGAYYFLKVKTLAPKVCTMDMKTCPDGSLVGRSGPNCEFAPCPKPSPTPVGETTNWKTYINKKHNYQVMYPPVWTTRENNNLSYDFISFEPSDTTKNDPNGSIGLMITKTSLFVKTEADAKNAFQTFMDSCSPDTPTECTKKVSDSYKFEKQVTVAGKLAFQTYGGCCEDFGRHIFLYHKDNEYRFTLYNLGPSSDKLRNEEVFNQILSTFKFLPASVVESQTVPSGSGICGTVTYVPGAIGFSPGGISTKLEIFTKKDNTFITSTKSGEDGKYKISLPPGEYKVVVTEYQIINFVTVEEKSCSNLDIRINAP